MTFYDFLSSTNDVNVPSNINKQNLRFLRTLAIEKCTSLSKSEVNIFYSNEDTAIRLALLCTAETNTSNIWDYQDTVQIPICKNTQTI